MKMFVAGLGNTATGYVASIVIDAAFGTAFKIPVSGPQTAASLIFSLLFVFLYLVIVLKSFADELLDVRNGFFYVVGALLLCWLLALSDWRQWIDFLLILVSYVLYSLYRSGYIGSGTFLQRS